MLGGCCAALDARWLGEESRDLRIRDWGVGWVDFLWVAGWLGDGLEIGVVVASSWS